jgi:hypothetical protein
MMAAAVVVVMVLVTPVIALEITAPQVSLLTTGSWAYPDPYLNSDVGVFRITFRVESSGLDGTIYLNNSVTSRLYLNGEPLLNTGVTGILFANDPEGSVAGWFEIEDGDTRDFTITATSTAYRTGIYHFRLENLLWSYSSQSPNLGVEIIPLASEFGTSPIFLRAVPEPATLALFAPAAMLLRRRRF